MAKNEIITNRKIKILGDNMYCNKCGNKINLNQKYCNKCGNYLTYNNQKDNIKYRTSSKNKKSNRISIEIPIFITALIIILIIIAVVNFIISDNKNNYYFGEEIAEKEEVAQIPDTQNNTSSKTGKYRTTIITDNVYYGISVQNADDAKKLIIEDSTKQKQTDYSEEIINIENDIINKYDITAVNLKEMEVDFARELENVIKKIYIEYPGARGHLTNLTLTNLDISNSGVIALFRPIFKFGKSDSTSTRPWVIKTQIQLNAKYFLNPERIKENVEASSKAGHFPKNATNYSPVAHELGHYLSFIAMMNHYSTNSILIIDDNNMQNYYDIYRDFAKGIFSKTMIEEAYNNYLKSNTNIGFDEWRGQISKYALAKDESGDYIYDETIAEAFHDVYLNGNNANIVSKYIVEVLKKYIGV